MTREEIMALGIEDLEARAAAIAIETAEADTAALELLNAELDAIEERKQVIETEVENKKKAAEAVRNGAGTVIETLEEVKKMTNKEIRNTDKYIEAYAKYLRTGKDHECRALLTEAVENGVVPVPEFVEEKILTAWETDEIFKRVTKSYVPGNLRVGFEASATGAEMHVEGQPEPTEEEIIIGVVDIVANYAKKWITVSDKVLTMGAREMLAYLFDEVEQKIVELVADEVVTKVMNAPAEHSATEVGVPVVTGDVDPANILQALGLLKSVAKDRVFISDGLTIANIKALALSGNYAYDPFFGLTVLQNDTLDGAAIVGDLAGVRANLPEGEAVKFIFDEYTLAEKDLVKIVGKLLVGVEVVQPGMFAVIKAE